MISVASNKNRMAVKYVETSKSQTSNARRNKKYIIHSKQAQPKFSIKNLQYYSLRDIKSSTSSPGENQVHGLPLASGKKVYLSNFVNGS